MESKLRAGVVGCGNIANTHAWVLTQLDDVEIVGFADTQKERAIDFSNRYTNGQAKAFDDFSKMLSECELDVLHICTPHYLHVPMAIMALENGVSVFGEKPPAISMEQFNQLYEITKNNKARIGFCFQNRYNKTIEKIDELLSDNKLGEVKGARAFLTWKRDKDYYETDWKGKLSTEGGGALINQSIHTLDLLLRYLGEPTKVEASLSNHHLKDIIEVEDTVEAFMIFNNDKRACFFATTSYVTDAPVILELQCENGRITLIDKLVTISLSNGEISNHLVLDKKGVGKDYWGNGHYACIKDYYEKLRLNQRFLNDLDGVRNTMEVMMEIYKNR